jgi:hypothetical protein
VEAESATAAANRQPRRRWGCGWGGIVVVGGELIAAATGGGGGAAAAMESIGAVGRVASQELPGRARGRWRISSRGGFVGGESTAVA